MLFIDPIFLSDTKEALLAPQFNWGNSTTLYGGQILKRLIESYFRRSFGFRIVILNLSVTKTVQVYRQHK